MATPVPLAPSARPQTGPGTANTPLVTKLHKLGAGHGRVEVVPASSHREASALAPYINLARGWNRQADMGRNPLFYDGTLTPATYRAWLDRWAVRHVVLPADTPDNGGEREQQLVRNGLPYLHQVWRDDDWRVFAVDHPTPHAAPHASTVRTAQDAVTPQVAKAGRIHVRIPYSPWLSLVDATGESLRAPAETQASKQARANNEPRPKRYANAHGCLRAAQEDASGDRWTDLLAPRPGIYRLAAPYHVPRGTRCPTEMQ